MNIELLCPPVCDICGLLPRNASCRPGNPAMSYTAIEFDHGGKTGRFQQVQETAEEYTFVLKAFGAN